MQINIHRRSKHEIDQAVADLEKRGFELVFGPLERKTNRMSNSGYNRYTNKFTSLSMSVGSFWYAKLKKEEA